MKKMSASLGSKIDMLLSKNEGLVGNLTSGFKFASKVMKDDSSITDAFNSVYRNSKGNLDVGNLAGTAFAASAAARIASGGGIYKNSKGETDLMGVPFI